jgi:translation initiation factor eIF-2B subunit alpha
LIDELRSRYRPRLRPIVWRSDDVLVILDQSRLPFEEVYLELTDVSSVAEAIRSMRVRGAPAIGIAAAYGMVLSLVRSGVVDLEGALRRLGRAKEMLDSSRPTAVNLQW